MGNIQIIPLDKIVQPASLLRSSLDDQALNELASSIRQTGVLQPILVNKRGESFILVAGVRRFLASQSLNLPTIPAIVLELSDEDSEIAKLHENLYREDISPYDEAVVMDSLEKNYHLSRDKISKLLGKSKSYVSQRLEILQYSPALQAALSAKELSFSVARSLSRVDNTDDLMPLLTSAVTNGATVRVVDEWIQNYLSTKKRLTEAQSLNPSPAESTLKPIHRDTCCFSCGSGPRGDLKFYPLCPDCQNALTVLDEEKI